MTTRRCPVSYGYSSIEWDAWWHQWGWLYGTVNVAVLAAMVCAVIYNLL
jgi:hypothetical protein